MVSHFERDFLLGINVYLVCGNTMRISTCCPDYVLLETCLAIYSTPGSTFFYFLYSYNLSPPVPTVAQFQFPQFRKSGQELVVQRANAILIKTCQRLQNKNCLKRF